MLQKEKKACSLILPKTYLKWQLMYIKLSHFDIYAMVVKQKYLCVLKKKIKIPRNQLCFLETPSNSNSSRETASKIKLVFLPLV